jgi:hypothetical protein
MKVGERFGGRHCLHLHGRRIYQARNQHEAIMTVKIVLINSERPGTSNILICVWELIRYIAITIKFECFRVVGLDITIICINTLIYTIFIAYMPYFTLLSSSPFLSVFEP